MTTIETKKSKSESGNILREIARQRVADRDPALKLLLDSEARRYAQFRAGKRIIPEEIKIRSTR